MYKLATAATAALVAQQAGLASALPHEAAHTRGLHARVPASSGDDVEDFFATATTDHFSFGASADWPNTFSLRYQLNDTFATDDGPVFLLLGGEGEIAGAWLTNPTEIMVNAEEFGATVIQLEHRFYGPTSDVSQPTGDMTTESLSLLNSQQALADAAEFVDTATALYGLEGKPWIAFGGSYSGSLAAWARLKYPHKFAGAVAWSAPVNAILDFTAYNEVVSDATAYVGEECLATLASGIAKVHDVLAQGDDDKIAKDFDLCEPLDGQADQQTFMEMLSGPFADGAQYGHDNRGFEGGDPITTLEELCDIIAAADTPYEAVIATNAKYNKDMGATCTDASYDEMVAAMADTTVEGGGAWRAWTWQTVAEFSYLQTTDSAAQPFAGFPLEYFTMQAPAVFGDGIEYKQSTIDATNNYYGGLNFQATNVVFPNGQQDPWHALSITADHGADLLPEGSVAIDAGHVAHCAGMYPADESDPAELTAARKLTTEYIAKWIS